MDSKVVLGVTAILCLAIVSICAMFALPDASKLVYAIIAIIAGIAGYELKPVIVAINKRITKRSR